MYVFHVPKPEQVQSTQGQVILKLQSLIAHADGQRHGNLVALTFDPLTVLYMFFTLGILWDNSVLSQKIVSASVHQCILWQKLVRPCDVMTS